MVGDKLSHEFNYMEHIATVHALYGENHVEKEMADNSDKDESKVPGAQKTEESVPVHLLNETTEHQYITTIISQPITFLQPFYIKDIFLPVVAQPPKIS